MKRYKGKKVKHASDGSESMDTWAWRTAYAKSSRRTRLKEKYGTRKKSLF